MLTLQDIYTLQSKYNVTDTFGKDEGRTFHEYLQECQSFLAANLKESTVKKDASQSSNLGMLRKHKQEELIREFIKRHKVPIQGYMEDGVLNTAKLMTDLVEEITGVGILKDAFEDDDIDEIQINDYKTIFVSRKGVLEPYIGSDGRALQFVDDTAITTLISRLLDDGTGNAPKITDGSPLINAKTAVEHYRVNLVHNSVVTRDKAPFDFPATAVLIRKFKKTCLTLQNIIDTGTLTPKMGKFLEFAGQAGLRTFFVGPTGSGKTTLLNIVANQIPNNLRILLVQNPTEIYLSDRDVTGRNRRNVVHMEVLNTDKQDENSSSATMPHLISNTLRQTPDITIVGEARQPEEFAQIMRVLEMGTPVLGTFHAENAEDGIERFVTELGGDRQQITKVVAKSINLIVSQVRFIDGSRRVMEISEINGVDKNGDPNINVLFEYRLTGKQAINPRNGLKYPDGSFWQVNPISPHLKNIFNKHSIFDTDLQEYIGDAKEHQMQINE